MPKNKFNLPGVKLTHSNNPNRSIPASKTDASGKGMGKLRSNQTIRRLEMYSSKVKRDRDGNIVKGGVLPASQRIEKGGMARIAPDRRW
jgi:nuclear GTP-binding protein